MSGSEGGVRPTQQRSLTDVFSCMYDAVEVQTHCMRTCTCMNVRVACMRLGYKTEVHKHVCRHGPSRAAASHRACVVHVHFMAILT